LNHAFIVPVVKAVVNPEKEEKTKKGTKSITEKKVVSTETEHLSLSLEDIIERYVLRELQREQDDMYSQKLMQREKQIKSKDKAVVERAESEVIEGTGKYI